LRCLPLDGLVALDADGGGRVQDDNVADDEPVEQPADGGEVLLLRRDAARMLSHVLTDVARRDASEPEAPLFAPREELPGGPGIRRAGVAVRKLAVEELPPCEDRSRPS